MIYDSKRIVAELKKILPTKYELWVNGDDAKPLITYRQYENRANEQSKVIEYSSIGYYIKVWADDLADVIEYIKKVDKTMRELGYKRTTYNELVLERQVCGIATYEAIGFENFRKG